MSENNNPDEIMKALGRTYAQLESYQDKGYVETTFCPGTDEERITKLTFETFFLRPNLFRFNWTDRFSEDSEERHHIIWCDGKSAHWKYPEQEKRLISMPFSLPNATRDLGLAIAGATGISSGTAHTISALLIPDVGGNRLIDLRNLEYVDNGEVQGENCYHIQKTNTQKKEETNLWISNSRLVVRKISMDYVLGGTREHDKEDEDLAKPPFWSPRRYIEPVIERLLLRQFGVKQYKKSEIPRKVAIVSKEFSVQSTTVYERVEINEDIPKGIFQGVG